MWKFCNTDVAAVCGLARRLSYCESPSDSSSNRKIFCGGEHTLIRHPKMLEVYQLGACGLGYHHDTETTSESLPYVSKVPVAGTVARVFPGYYHNFLKMNDGRCYAYGCGRQDPNDGQLINNSTKEDTQPVLTVEEFSSVALGGHHTIASKVGSGEVFACGAGWQGQMGNGSLQYKNENIMVVPELVRENVKVKKLATGYYHNAVQSDDGEWYVWGCNESSQLGVFGIPQMICATKLSLLQPFLEDKKIVDFDGGYVHSVLLSEDGKVYTMGGHTEGQRALDPESESPPFLNQVEVDGRVEAIACGNHHVLLLIDGKVYGFGSDEFGQVQGAGVDEEDDERDYRIWHVVPVHGLPDDDPVIGISAGMYHSAAETKSGKIFVWGGGGNGQTGDQTLPYSSAVRELDIDNIAKQCETY